MGADVQDLQRLDRPLRLADLAGAPAGPGVYALWPAHGPASHAIGLRSGSADTALFVGAASRSLREALAEHLLPADEGDSDLRAELAVWLAEVREELPWHRQSRLGASHRFLGAEPGTRFACKVDDAGRPQGLPRPVEEGSRFGAGDALLPHTDPSDARRRVHDLRPGALVRARMAGDLRRAAALGGRRRPVGGGSVRARPRPCPTILDMAADAQARAPARVRSGSP